MEHEIEKCWKTNEYVEAECESLAEQLAAIKRQPSRINEPEDI